MSPDEFKLLKQLSEENSATQKAILELKMIFQKFTVDKEQRRKDELARCRERC